MEINILISFNLQGIVMTSSLLDMHTFCTIRWIVLLPPTSIIGVIKLDVVIVVGISSILR